MMKKIRLIPTLRYIKILFLLPVKKIYIKNLLNSRHCVMHGEGSSESDTFSSLLKLWSWVVCDSLCPLSVGANTVFITFDQKQILKQTCTNNRYNLFSAVGFVCDTSNR